MGLDLDAVGRTAGPAEVAWTSTDALLYALGVGAGQDDPLAELELTTENTAGFEQRVLPTYAIVIGQRGPHIGLGDFDRSRVVHAGPTPPSGRPTAWSGCGSAAGPRWTRTSSTTARRPASGRPM